MDRMTKEMDLETMIRTNLDLRLLIRRLLTPEQQTLFKYQRDRLLSAKSSDSEESECDDLWEISEKESLKKQHMKKIRNFVPSSDLDRRLLVGLIRRDKSAPKPRPVHSVLLEDVSERKCEDLESIDFDAVNNTRVALDPIQGIELKGKKSVRFKHKRSHRDSV